MSADRSYDEPLVEVERDEDVVVQNGAAPQNAATPETASETEPVTTPSEDGDGTEAAPDTAASRRRGRPISGPDQAVDHERTPGVPPPSVVDDYDDLVDTEGAGSFPASDPPSGW